VHIFRLVLAVFLAALLLVLSHPLAAQSGGLGAPCAQLPEGEPRQRCFSVAQAAESAHPQLGLLIGGGNPILGDAGAAGIRLAVTPRFDFSPRLNVVFVRIPDILAAELGATAERVNQALGIPAPALGTTISLGVFPGFDAAPGVGGLGSLDVLAGATWLPFGLVDTDGFSRSSPFAWSAGGRIGLLRESFALPAVSVAVLHRGLARTSFGHVCRATLLPDEEICLGPGDVGEFSFDLRDWSTRFAVSKRFLGLGAAGGVGYDRFSGDVGYAVRYPMAAGTARVVRVDPVRIENDRWSVFGNLAYHFLVSSVVLEAGWMQGGTPVPGYGVRDFDPRSGVWFGSLGGRIGF
jgi:hypothetical protein